VAGKSIVSRNALRHGLRADTHQSVPSAEIERLAKAICRDDNDPALFAQARLIGECDLILRAIQAQRIALIERLREPTAIALASGDNSIELAEARSNKGQLAYKELKAHILKMLIKYKARMPPELNVEGVPDNIYKKVDLSLLVGLLLSFDPTAEEAPALDLASKQIAAQERDEFEALEEALPDLIRLERYESRAWSRQKRAIRTFMNIKLIRAPAGVPARGF